MLFSAHWLPAQLFYLAAVMMLIAGAAVFGMGHLYGAKAGKRPAPTPRPGESSASALPK
jgi:AAHS family 4-hydroxybenzoate transporter-like MFS transporter